MRRNAWVVGVLILRANECCSLRFVDEVSLVGGGVCICEYGVDTLGKFVSVKVNSSSPVPSKRSWNELLVEGAGVVWGSNQPADISTGAIVFWSELTYNPLCRLFELARDTLCKFGTKASGSGDVDIKAGS